MAKGLKYDSLKEKVFAERDVKQILEMLVTILEAKLGPFFEDGVNEHYGTPSGDPHPLDYHKAP